MTKLKLVAALFFATATLMGCTEPDAIATVDGRDITAEEFNAYLKFKRIPEQDEARVARALDDYIQRAALTAAIEKTDKLDADLAESELEEFRRQMHISRYFEDYLRQSVDDDAVLNYYSNNAENYQTQRTHVAHILIRVDGKMGESERQAKLSSAHEAYSRIQKGEDFAEVAKTASEDTVSAQKGGDLGWLAEGAVDPAFSKRVFAMEPGEVSEPFLTPFGFHVVKVLDGPQLVKRPVESVEGDIRYQLRNNSKVAETERLLEMVKIVRKDQP